MRSIIARGLKWQAINAAGRQVLSLVVFTMLARLLEPGAFGLIGLVGVYLAFVSIIADQGISAALIQRKELEPKHLHAAFWFNTGAALLLSAGTVLAAGPVAAFFNEPLLAPLLAWSSLALVINALSAVQSTLFVKEMDFRQPAIRAVLGSAVGGAVGVGMALSGAGVWALVGQQLATSLAATVFLCLVSHYRPAFQFSFRHLKDLLGVSSSVFFTGMLWFAASRVDQIVIGRFFGAAALGLYVVGGKMPALLRSITHQPLNDLALPALSQLQHDHARMREVIYKGMALNSIVSLPIFVGLAAVAPVLVPLLFGTQWLEATPFLELIAIYILVMGLFTYCHPTLLATGASRSYLVINTVCAAGAVMACLAAIPFGVQAIVPGLIANILVTGGLSLAVLRSRMGLSPWLYCKPVIAPAAASIVMFIAVRAATPFMDATLPGIVSLAAQMAAGALIFGALMLTLANARVLQLWEMIRSAVGSRSVVGLPA